MLIYGFDIFMRFVIINRHLRQTIGGSEIQCDLIAQGLHERGHDVIYIVPGKAFATLAIPYSIRHVKNNADAIAEGVTAVRPDVVYWRYNKHHLRGVASSLAAAGIPMVFAVAHINDLLPWAVKPVHTTGLRGWVRQLRQRLQVRWEHSGFHYVQTLTTLNREFLSLSPVADAHYIPNAMRAEAESFHWPRPYVAWVANIKPAKRPELFVEATRVLAEHGIDGLMIGHIQSRGYDWLTDPQRIPPNFHYLGSRTPSEVNGVLANSRLHVHTCQPEGFGNVFIQAWMQGRPSVSLEFDPCGYIAEQRLGAVAGGCINTFIRQVVDWATHPERADEVGKRAQVFARETFSVDTMVDRVERILESVVRSAKNRVSDS